MVCRVHHNPPAADREADARTGERVPIFNLSVADDKTYFVGQTEFLIHDNSLPDRGAIKPFDGVPALAESSPEGQVEASRRAWQTAWPAAAQAPTSGSSRSDATLLIVV
jgi:hypothetical protein